MKTYKDEEIAKIIKQAKIRAESARFASRTAELKQSNFESSVNSAVSIVGTQAIIALMAGLRGLR